MIFAFNCGLAPELAEFNMFSSAWVVVDLSPERVALLKQQIELANQTRRIDPTLRELQFKWNEVEVHDFLPSKLEGEDGEREFDKACGRGWAILPDDLDLTLYDLVEHKFERFCVCPATGKRPATFHWLIRVEGKGPGRTIKWRLKDLEKALSKETARRNACELWYLDDDAYDGFEPIEVSTGE